MKSHKILKINKLNKLFLLLVISFFLACTSNTKLTKQNEFDSQMSSDSAMHNLKMGKIKSQTLIKLPKAKYHFNKETAFTREYYISNHDQDNPKKSALVFENLKNIVIDGRGSEIILHDKMIAFSFVNCENITLKNFTIDYALPSIRQLKVLELDKENSAIIVEIYPSGHYKIEKQQLYFTGNSGISKPLVALPFKENGRLAYKKQDLIFNPKSVTEISPDTLVIKNWQYCENAQVGDVFALRDYSRPYPGIFISESKNINISNVKVHFADGMGLLAQMSENIYLNKFSVCLPKKNNKRYFTTQADATHFSGCKGEIVSQNGFYEAMADDAINVHGTYLNLQKRIDNNTVHAQYMHHQTWGIKWGEIGDTVQFIDANKMEIIDNQIYTIQKIKALDKATNNGAKAFEIVFNESLSEKIKDNTKIGIENLTWTPKVIFKNNIIRNNRARGALFSTPKQVICENNTFDHTHGTAILLCGDSNDWYETGACKNVIIRKNKFINALTANYQFTNAVISIYPEIPNLKEQNKFFHSNITIENNVFYTFDRPILYAKSTENLVFRNNKIKYNTDFQPFHWNKYVFFFEKVKNVEIENNKFSKDFSPEKDVNINLSEKETIIIKNNK